LVCKCLNSDVLVSAFAGKTTNSKNLGRSFIGIEKDAEYFEIAKQMISV